MYLEINVAHLAGILCFRLGHCKKKNMPSGRFMLKTGQSKSISKMHKKVLKKTTHKRCFGKIRLVEADW